MQLQPGRFCIVYWRVLLPLKFFIRAWLNWKGKKLFPNKKKENHNSSISGYIFNEDNGKCYKLHTTPMNWNDSYAICRLEQSHLAVITSRQEANYLGSLTEFTPNPRVKENYQRGIYHVGLHNKFKEGWQTVKGMWMCIYLSTSKSTRRIL